MPKSHRPSVDYIRQRLEYRDGKLFWLERPREHFPIRDNGSWRRWNNKHAGKEAGHRMKMGSKARPLYYWGVTVDWGFCLRSHLVWAIHHGQWPDMIDHKNRISTDDRIDNLRLATRSQNNANVRRRSDNRAGFKGVTRANGKWKSRIYVNKELIPLGVFTTPEEAFAAYCAAAKKHFGEFACDGEKAIT